MKNIFLLLVLIVCIEKLQKDVETDMQFNEVKESEIYKACIYKFVATEGIVLKPYVCAAGYATFGIGCVIDTDKERLICIKPTIETVKEHLIFEWQSVVDGIEADAPNIYTIEQKAALAMLFMSIGKERFFSKNKSHFEGYKNGIGIPEKVWLSQVHYKSKKTGKWIKSKNLVLAKVFEFALFSGDTEKVLRMGKAYKKTHDKIIQRLK